MLLHERAECLLGELLDYLARPIAAGALVPALSGFELEWGVPDLDITLELAFPAAGVFRPSNQIRIAAAIAESRGVGEQLSAEVDISSHDDQQSMAGVDETALSWKRAVNKMERRIP